MLSSKAAQDSYLDYLKGDAKTISAELRPPRANAPGRQSMDDWIDIYHTVRRLTIGGNRVFITDTLTPRVPGSCPF